MKCKKCKKQYEYLLDENYPNKIILKCSCDNNKKSIRIATYDSIINKLNKIPKNNENFSKKRYYIWKYYEKKIKKFELTKQIIFKNFKENKFNYYCKHCLKYFNSFSEHNEVCDSFSNQKINLMNILPMQKQKEIKDNMTKTYEYVNNYYCSLKNNVVNTLEEKINEAEEIYNKTKMLCERRLLFIKDLFLKASIEKPKYIDVTNLLNNVNFSLKNNYEHPTDVEELKDYFDYHIFKEQKLLNYDVQLQQEVCFSYEYLSILNDNIISISSKNHIIKFLDSYTLQPIRILPKEETTIVSIVQLSNNRIAYATTNTLKIYHLKENRETLEYYKNYRHIISKLISLPNDVLCIFFNESEIKRGYYCGIVEPYNCYFIMMNSYPPYNEKVIYKRQYKNNKTEVCITKSKYHNRLIISKEKEFEILNSVTFQIETILKCKNTKKFFEICKKFFAIEMDYKLYIFDNQTFQILNCLNTLLINDLVYLGNEYILVTKSDDLDIINVKGVQFIFNILTGEYYKCAVTPRDILDLQLLNDNIIFARNNFVLQIWKYNVVPN